MAISTFTEPSFLKTLFKIVFFQRPDVLISNLASQTILSQVKSNPKLTSKTIPEEISFRRMMAGGTFPPLTQVDFMEYLTAVSDSEYLNFLVCIEHYKKLWEAIQDTNGLCKPFTPQGEHNARHIVTTAIHLSRAVFGNVPINLEHLHVKPFQHFIQTPKSNHPDLTRNSAGQRLQEEANWMMRTFIVQGAPQEFNLDCLTRNILIYALHRTYHPSAFRLAVVYANEVLQKHYTSLVKASTPVPVNSTRIITAYLIGISLIISGIGYSLMMVMSKHGRAWRILSFPLQAFGAAFVYATFHRLSVVLVPLGHYKLKPWDVESNDWRRLVRIRPERSMVGQSDVTWAGGYNRRFSVRKWFDKETAIQDPRLRYGEVVLMGQALWVGILFGGLCLMALLWIPPVGMW